MMISSCPIVIQSEAKDLKSVSLCIQILPPFGRLNDKKRGLLHYVTPTLFFVGPYTSLTAAR